MSEVVPAGPYLATRKHCVGDRLDSNGERNRGASMKRLYREVHLLPHASESEFCSLCIAFPAMRTVVRSVVNQSRFSAVHGTVYREGAHLAP